MQDNEPLSPDGLVDVLEDLYLLLHPHQTARNPANVPVCVAFEDSAYDLDSLAVAPVPERVLGIIQSRELLFF